ncbi:MAG: DUF4252 domain-containing protein [Dysgonomonas sp.]|nr:DUF4252 domain-containing protein [Dysgonomonas sp.]
MKRIFLYIVISFITVHAMSQSFDNIVSEFSKAENVDKVNISRFGWNYIKAAFIGNKDASIIRKISSLQILDLEDCSSDTKARFVDRIDNLKDKKYELLMMVKDESSEVLIMSKSRKNKIRELIIIDKKEPTLVWLKGKFSLSDLSSDISQIAKQFK